MLFSEFKFKKYDGIKRAELNTGTGIVINYIL